MNHASADSHAGRSRRTVDAGLAIHGACARLRVYLKADINRSVIARDTDLLTAQDYRNHPHEVLAAILEELKVWVAHGCIDIELISMEGLCCNDV